MTETTREQDAVVEELALEYGAVSVRAGKRESVIIRGRIEYPGGFLETEPRCVSPDGERACWSCGATEYVEPRGAYADLCDYCWDDVAEQLS